MAEQRLVDMKYQLAPGSRNVSDATLADLIPQLRSTLDRQLGGTDYQIIALTVVGGVAVITLGIGAGVAAVYGGSVAAILLSIGAVLGLVGIVWNNSQSYDYQAQSVTAQTIPDYSTLAAKVGELVANRVITPDQGAEILRRFAQVANVVADQGSSGGASVGGTISQVLNSPVVLIVVLLLAYNATKR